MGNMGNRDDGAAFIYNPHKAGIYSGAGQEYIICHFTYLKIQ